MAGWCKASVVLDIQHAHTHNALLFATSGARALAAVFGGNKGGLGARRGGAKQSVGKEGDVREVPPARLSGCGTS